MLDLQYVLDYLPVLLRAAETTVVLTFLSLLVAAAVAVPFAILRDSSSPLRHPVSLWGWYTRATPGLLLMYFAYYALPSVGIVLPAFETAAIALGLAATGTQIEIFRAGFNSVSRGQLEAARALGLSPFRTWRRVTAPQALIVIIPLYISNATLQLKGTSLAAIITVRELTGAGLGIIEADFRPFEILVTIALIYLILNSVLVGAQVVAERRVARR